MRRSISAARLFMMTVVLLATSGKSIAGEQPLSVVDYMKAVGTDSSFANRKKIYIGHWSAEQYAGTADQNLKLLNYLLANAKQVRVPSPSSQVEHCKDFYNDPEISKFLTKAFKANAVSACVVTGTKIPQNVIRRKLQELYSSIKPANGDTFTAEEHK